jgi:hypothetical protein
MDYHVIHGSAHPNMRRSAIPVAYYIFSTRRSMVSIVSLYFRLLVKYFVPVISIVVSEVQNMLKVEGFVFRISSRWHRGFSTLLMGLKTLVFYCYLLLCFSR